MEEISPWTTLVVFDYSFGKSYCGAVLLEPTIVAVTKYCITPQFKSAKRTNRETETTINAYPAKDVMHYGPRENSEVQVIDTGTKHHQSDDDIGGVRILKLEKDMSDGVSVRKICRPKTKYPKINCIITGWEIKKNGHETTFTPKIYEMAATSQCDNGHTHELNLGAGVMCLDLKEFFSNAKDIAIGPLACRESNDQWSFFGLMSDGRRPRTPKILFTNFLEYDSKGYVQEAINKLNEEDLEDCGKAPVPYTFGDNTAKMEKMSPWTTLVEFDMAIGKTYCGAILLESTIMAVSKCCIRPHTKSIHGTDHQTEIIINAYAAKDVTHHGPEENSAVKVIDRREKHFIQEPQSDDSIQILKSETSLSKGATAPQICRPKAKYPKLNCVITGWRIKNDEHETTFTQIVHEVKASSECGSEHMQEFALKGGGVMCIDLGDFFTDFKDVALGPMACYESGKHKWTLFGLMSDGKNGPEVLFTDFFQYEKKQVVQEAISELKIEKTQHKVEVCGKALAAYGFEHNTAKMEMFSPWTTLVVSDLATGKSYCAGILLEPTIIAVSKYCITPARKPKGHIATNTVHAFAAKEVTVNGPRESAGVEMIDSVTQYYQSDEDNVGVQILKLEKDTSDGVSVRHVCRPKAEYPKIACVITGWEIKMGDHLTFTPKTYNVKPYSGSDCDSEKEWTFHLKDVGLMCLKLEEFFANANNVAIGPLTCYDHKNDQWSLFGLKSDGEPPKSAEVVFSDFSEFQQQGHIGNAINEVNKVR